MRLTTHAPAVRWEERSETDMNAQAPSSVQGVVTKASPRSVAETVDRLQAVVRARGLTVFALIDHSGEAERAGLAMPPTMLLVFGSPKAGTPLMLAFPLLALDLPLKALVWQDAAAHVWVSYDSPDYLAERYAIPQTLVGNIAGVGAIVEEAIQGPG